MRLLQLGKQDELLITHDLYHPYPPYAILSHTWGLSTEEYTFDDLRTHQGQGKMGYQKVLSFGKQAQRDGLAYFWVDTCCIDKTSSAELSEAINSMFGWYHNAQKCYVYLADVENIDGNGGNTEFRNSRWFTRGWTLQELIAPRQVEFFSSSWQLLGDKRSMEQTIHEITNIPHGVLRGCPLSDFTIQERMAWARGRKTTRLEDQAYSLLGIFDVFMPLIYGEGGGALKRLQREIELVRSHSSSGSPIGRVHNGDNYFQTRFHRKDRWELTTEEEDEISDKDDVESLFSDSGSSISSKSSVERNPVRVSGIREITRTFLSHRGFRSLCDTAINNVAAGKSRKHIRGFLKRYGQQLDEEASSPLQHQAAKFIREVAGRLSDEISWSINGFERPQERESSAYEKPDLEKWLSTVGKVEPERALSPPPIDESAPFPPPADDSDSDGDESEDDLGPDEAFPNIEAVNDFLLSSKAFGSLLRDFEAWIKLKRSRNPFTNYLTSPKPKIQEMIASCEPISDADLPLVDHLTPSTSDTFEKPPLEGFVGPSTTRKTENFESLGRSIFDFWGITFSFYDLLDLFLPSPPAGCERFRWRCTCDTILWGDFPIDDSNALMQLKEDLLRDLLPPSNSPRTESSRNVTAEHLSGIYGAPLSPGHDKVDHLSVTSMASAPGNTMDSSPTGGPNHKSSTSVLGPSELDSVSARPVDLTKVTVDTCKPTYFEVCINIGNFAVGHFELDISRTTTDDELFKKIWDIYNHSRGFGLRRLFLRPRNVHFVLFSISTVKTTRYSAGIQAKPEEYPPDVELQCRRYHYHTPKIMMPPHVFLHFLHRARRNVWGDHASDTWLKRLPKKLNDSILALQLSEASPDSDLVLGWGVHILDGPNHVVLGFLLAAGLVITFVISCLIAGIAKTQEQAFGVGSYLIAIVVALMSAVYFKLQDQ